MILLNQKKFILIVVIILIGLLFGVVVGYFVMPKKVNNHLALPSTCVDESEGVPVIISITPSSSSVGTTIEIIGCNLRGFEGDKNIWIVDSKGEKGILYGERDEDFKSIKITLVPQLCRTDESYRGEQCASFLDLIPGDYKIYTTPLGKKSNEVSFTVLDIIDSYGVVDEAWGVPALPPGFMWNLSSEEFSNDKVMGPQGDPIELKGKTYIVKTTGKEPYPDVFSYYAKELYRDWTYSVIDDESREFVAPAADGMRGSVTGALKIRDGHLRAITYSTINSSPSICFDTLGDPHCPVQTYEQRVFISNPTPLNQIPGKAFKG